MDDKNKRWKQRLEHYNEALLTIEEVAPRFADLNELEKDGLIQRFEFTFDLAWKVMQDQLAFAGYDAVKGPRPCITQMAQNGLIDVFLWSDMLTARNELGHIYDEGKSRGYLDNIIEKFLPAMLHFRQQMNKMP